jgi:phosphonatase-like hydrolase
MIELVALDMAGTTIEDHGAVYDALHAAVAETGAEVIQAQVQLWMGTDKRDAIRALASLGGAPPLDTAGVEAVYGAFREELAERYRARPPEPIPGAPEALAVLRADGIRVALTTGFAHDVADPLLASLGWEVGGDLVDALVCADDVAAGRPAPYMIFRAMELTGVQAVDQVLVAGDTHADLDAGTSSGAAVVVGVATGRLTLPELATHAHTHLLASVADLPALVLSLLSS